MNKTFYYLDVEDLKFITDILGEDFLSSLKDKSIFLTGATGVIGKWILEFLFFLNENFSSNVQITVLVRDKNKLFKLFPSFCHYCHIVEGDVTDPQFISAISKPIDFIIHAAAPSSQNFLHLNQLSIFDTIVTGSANVLALACNHHPSKILFLSSGAVYGPCSESRKISESHLSCSSSNNLNFCYAIAKTAAEHLFFLYAALHNIKINILRIFSIVGPFLPLNIHFAIGNFIRDALNGGPIFVQGDGSSVRSYIYLADLVVWIFKIMLQGIAGEIYNVGSPFPICIKDLALKISELTLGVKNIRILSRDSSKYRSYYVPSISKAQKDLDLNIYTSLDESIFKTFNFYLK